MKPEHDPAKLNEALTKQGLPLELEAFRSCQSRGWLVAHSVPYEHPQLEGGSKTREIDVVAQRHYVLDLEGSVPYECDFRVFIECKHATGWWVFVDLSEAPPKPLDYFFADEPRVGPLASREVVIDSPMTDAGMLSTVLFVHRELIYSSYLEAVLAHECGHIKGGDAHLVMALRRFAIPGTLLMREWLLTMGWPVSAQVLLTFSGGWGAAFPGVAGAWRWYFRRGELYADRQAAKLGYVSNSPSSSKPTLNRWTRHHRS
jgi:hypothetical protein